MRTRPLFRSVSISQLPSDDISVAVMKGAREDL